MCGLFGVSHSPTASYDIFKGLQQLQHRGQDGGGIVTFESETLHHRHGMGLLASVFDDDALRYLKGTSGVGHTRYATVGGNTAEFIQPFVNPELKLALAHNGNLVNYHERAQEIQAINPIALKTQSDSELILYYLSEVLADSPLTFEVLSRAVQHVSKHVVGAYSVVCYMEGLGLFGFRSPHGLRPLVLGQKPLNDETAYAFASESIALEATGYKTMEDILAAELVLIDTSGTVHRSNFASSKPKHCMFEWVYFARVESEIDGLPLYDARFQLGQQLAEEVKRRNLQPDVVVPVPETSRIAAVSLADALNIPCREGLIKNRYSNRTFILESEAARHDALLAKLFPIRSVIEGQKILVVDDSIVRGNTARKIIQMLRQTGAKEIYLASTCPPIKNPCYFGIDFPSSEELPAATLNEEEMRKLLGVDALIYQSIEGLHKGLNNLPLCDACLTGDYPMDTSAASGFTERRKQQRAGNDKLSSLRQPATKC